MACFAALTEPILIPSNNTGSENATQEGTTAGEVIEATPTTVAVTEVQNVTEGTTQAAGNATGSSKASWVCCHMSCSDDLLFS